MENQMQKNKLSFFQSNTAKIMMIGALTLLLLIPLALVRDLIQERSQRKDDVTTEVANTWGRDIEFMGPILKIPYKSVTVTEVTNPKNKAKRIEKHETIKYAYFFPEKLENKTAVTKVDDLKRGLYNPIVFKANISATGSFENIDFKKLDIPSEDILWDKARVLIKTTNLKSIKSDLKIKLNQQNHSLEAKSDVNDKLETLETLDFHYVANQTLNFSFTIDYNGSNSILFIPIGKTTTTAISANWGSPSFIGNFAPNNSSKKIENNSFFADWKIIHVNRPYPQQFSESLPDLNSYTYGVKLIEPVDEYQQNERASKYGFLVIGLTFMIFFLIQTISKINIHVFQYTMIGLALILFYTLLISITEHTSFTTAYIIASSAVIIMLLLYSIAVLKNKKFPLFIAGSLTLLYGFIFVIIQLENYALLVGSVGLFLILGIIMYFSRKIDWYSK